MKQMKVQWGNGTYKLSERIINIEDFESEMDAIDKCIDGLEQEGSLGCFIDQNETLENNGIYSDDEYIIGGNHGLILYHGGCLRISEIDI